MASIIGLALRGIDAVNQVINTNTNTPEYRLADDICQRMIIYENISKDVMKPTILGLYLHFLLSLIGIFESTLKMLIFSLLPLIYILLWLTAYILYYITLCISCGRSEGTINIIEKTCIGITRTSSLFFIYFGITIGLLGNLIIPWNAPYSFYKTRVYLKRPPGSKPIVFDMQCGDTTMFIPKYIICSHFLFISGGINSLFYSLFFEDYMRIVVANYENEVEKDTLKFYQESFQCPGFDQLLYNASGGSGGSRSGGGGGGGNSRQQSVIREAVAVPIDSNQPYTYAQVAYEVPQQQEAQQLKVLGRV